jgi:hypothetical protein
MTLQHAVEVAFPFRVYWYVVIGVLISVILPILRALLPTTQSGNGEKPAWKRYLAVGIFSLLTSIIVLAFAKDQPKDWQWYDAVLAGFAWDSLLQKAVNGGRLGV